MFVIDPDRNLRAMIHDPLNVGRNFDEILRLVDALQTTDAHGMACPANWTPGDPVIVPPPGTAQEAAQRLQEGPGQGYEVTDWYFSKKTL